MKQYFADNSQEMGISPDMFSDEEYEILYGVYVEEKLNKISTSEQIKDAVTLFENYMNEYRKFLADINEAANVTKNWELIKTVLNAEYSYISVELADESVAVNKEYLYKRMFDIDASSLETVKTAFENAVIAEIEYETYVKYEEELTEILKQYLQGGVTLTWQEN